MFTFYYKVKSTYLAPDGAYNATKGRKVCCIDTLLSRNKSVNNFPFASKFSVKYKLSIDHFTFKRVLSVNCCQGD